MPRRKSESQLLEEFDSVRKIILSTVTSGAQDKFIDNSCYQAIYQIGYNNMTITEKALLAKSAKPKPLTSDHIYRPRLWGKVFRQRPEILKSMDSFYPIINELRTSCVCLTAENELVKERKKKNFPRSRTRSLYPNCKIVIYDFPGDYRDVKKVPVLHRVPDFMDELEQEILGWV